MSAADHNATLARGYLNWLSTIRGRRPTTTHNYAATLDAYLLHLGERRADASRSRTWKRSCSGRAYGSPRLDAAAAGTLAREATTLRSFYAYLQQRGHTERNPALFLACSISAAS